MRDSRYYQLLTKDQWVKIYERMRVYWPHWELEVEALKVWHAELSDIPGVFIWSAICDLRDDPEHLRYAPGLRQLVLLSEAKYGYMRDAEFKDGIRRRGGGRLHHEQITRVAAASEDERPELVQELWAQAVPGGKLNAHA